MSVNDKIFLPSIDFERFVVACLASGFLILALTAIQINWAATLTAGLRSLIQVHSVLSLFF